jgi:hypothetical protein
MWQFRFNKKRYGLLIAIMGSSESLRDVYVKWYPCTHCSKRVYKAKALQNHGTRDHDWSFLTWKPKRNHSLKARILAS